MSLPQTGPERWKYIKKSSPEGHKLFWDLNHPGMLAIADDSGRRPDTTDDGPLWVTVLDGDISLVEHGDCNSLLINGLAGTLYTSVTFDEADTIAEVLGAGIAITTKGGRILDMINRKRGGR